MKRDPIFKTDGIKNRFLGRKKNSGVVDNIFDPVGSKELTGDGLASSAGFLSLLVNKRKIFFLGFLIIAGCLLILGRTFYLQIIKGGFYFNQARGNSIRLESVPARRGVIYDRNNQQLVYNVSTFDLILTPMDLPGNEEEEKKAIDETAALAGTTPEEIKNKIDEVRPYLSQPITIKENLSYDDAMLFMIKNLDLPGLKVASSEKRNYVASESAQSLSHIFGYVGRLNKEEYEVKKNDDYFLNDYIGKTGLEKFYEKDLKGINGKKQIEVSPLGNEIQTLAESSAQNGSDLILTIDYDLQKKAEEILNGYLKKFNKRKGAVVAINPQNGEILALVSLPSYDDNQFSAGISAEDYQKLTEDPAKPLFDRAISGAYPSGSTIKPVMAAAALQEKVIDDKTSFVSTGGVKIDKWFFPDWKAGGHGVTNVYKAIAESVNTFFYKIGGGYPKNGIPSQGYEFNGLGPERIDKYLELFGLGQKSGIDLPGEETGFVPTVDWKNKTTGEQWYIGDTYNLSIGQGNLLVTPLQVANWTATVANGGTLYKPHLVKEISTNGQVTHEIDKEVVNQGMISPENIEIVRQAMRQTVISGTARSFYALPVEVAAKTGTAQWRNDRPNHAWFTCFAQFENPEIVVTVLIEEGVEGSSTAAPVTRDLLNWYFDEHQILDKKN